MEPASRSCCTLFPGICAPSKNCVSLALIITELVVIGGLIGYNFLGSPSAVVQWSMLGAGIASTLLCVGIIVLIKKSACMGRSSRPDLEHLVDEFAKHLNE